MKKLLTLTVLFFSLNLLAVPTYYTQDFLNTAVKGKLTGDLLKESIYVLLTSDHQMNNGAPDTLGCSAGKNCYRHKVLGYDGARKVLFGRIHLKQNERGYYIQDVYCKKIFTSGNAKVGPGAIPADKINCEHTWPQSRFTGSFDKEMQKSDIHHLYPTDKLANSVRGNFEFAEISYDTGHLPDCSASKSGVSTTGGDNNFEPPQEHKGNVARALFYFSVRYKIAIKSDEEEVLRRWHQLDPVDDDELNRNNIINEVQGNRNPFIDFPELANYINNF